MRFGVVGLNKLTEKEKEKILNEIIENCVKYAGDSYEDFARPVIKLLKKNNLVAYGN